jgi:hypothetical protein
MRMCAKNISTVPNRKYDVSTHQIIGELSMNERIFKMQNAARDQEMQRPRKSRGP